MIVEQLNFGLICATLRSLQSFFAKGMHMFKVKTPSGSVQTRADIKTLLSRVRIASQKLAVHNRRLGKYFVNLDEPSVDSQRSVKDKLPQKLRDSEKAIQVITVRKRGANNGGTFVILPLDLMAETLEVQVEDVDFVPVLDLLREVGDGVELNALPIMKAGTRRRSTVPSFGS